IKERIQRVAREGTGTVATAGLAQHGVVIVEVGGTVGDIESLPFLEAIRQMRKDVGRRNVLYVHVTLLPQIGATGELKTKPTQHSVSTLRGIGIQPDVIILRSDEPIDDEILDKVALFTDVDVHAVIPLRTARSTGIPFLGVCLALQFAVSEFAREVRQTDDANSSEFNALTANPVTDLMPDPDEVAAKGGTMRLGPYPSRLVEGSKVREAYG